MILPYSTDAPIYHFPWMTIVLIVVNCLTFALTGMGYNDEGWLLQYGNGLHPLEWVAYNFLHFGIGHLLGNMFFLWAFGIVVEGKLGWWKFLGVYMTIGIVGGFLIQLTMLGYKSDFEDLSTASSRRSPSWFEPTPAFAQDDDGDDGPDMAPGMNGVPAGNFPVGEMDPEDDERLTPQELAREKAFAEEFRRAMADVRKPGAGGASLIVFALLGIVLVWAPKNEISCLWIGLNAGTFEMEYVYFCGFKIGIEIIGAIFAAPGFEVTSEVAHALGAVLGFGIGAAFVKLNWVDCENWDLFAYAQNKHGAMEHVGSWQDAAAISIRNDKKVTVPVRDDDDDDPRLRANRKKRAMPKLQALQSLDDEVVEEDVAEEEPIEIPDEPKAPSKKLKATKSTGSTARAVPPLPSTFTKPVAGTRPSLKSAPPVPPSAPAPIADTSPLDRIRSALKNDSLNEALAEVRRQRSSDPGFQLPLVELRGLADGFFKLQNVRDSKPFLEEFIERFPEEADRQRVKLAVLNVKFLKRPTAALKLLAKVDRSSLPDEYQSIHKEAARQAQQMISDGIVDAS